MKRSDDGAVKTNCDNAEMRLRIYPGMASKSNEVEEGWWLVAHGLTGHERRICIAMLHTTALIRWSHTRNTHTHTLTHTHMGFATLPLYQRQVVNGMKTRVETCRDMSKREGRARLLLRRSPPDP